MDLDDLDGPSQVPSRTSKFAPKSSRFQPKPSLKPEQPVSVSKPELEQSVSAPKPEPQNASVFRIDERETKPSINASTATGGPPVPGGSVEKEAGAVANQDDSMDVDEVEGEGDVVVREIDVFFTPSVGADTQTQLYVMQYPLRPCWRPYELEDRCEEVRVKPESREVEIDLSVDDSRNWDTNCAERLKMTKQTLQSTWRPVLAESLAVGVLMGNKLYLNPIHAAVQLRPSMEHLNSGSSKRKNSITNDAEVTVKLEDSHEVKSIGPSKKQNKRTVLANEQMSDVGESWIRLKYHGSKTDLSSRYLQKMMAHESAAIDFTMNPYEYMSSLCPGPSNNNSKPRVYSRRLLLALPLDDRFKKLLLEGPPFQRFSALKHYAPNDSIEDVLAVLQKYGQLVQGLWAPKTSLVFPNPDPKEKIKAAARDYALLLFTKNLVIKSSQFSDIHKILKEDMKRFLNMFADELSSSKDWKFKQTRDAAFIKEYPEIVKKQAEAWDGIEKRLNEVSQKIGSRPGMKNPITMPVRVQNPLKSLKSDKSTTKKASGVLTRRTITDETREAIWKALPKVFQNHKVCSFELICQALRDLAISQSTLPKADPRTALAAASGLEAPKQELQEVISEVATNIHGFYVLKSSIDHPEYDPLRKVLIDLLLARGPNAKLKKAEVLEAARLALKRDIANNEYNKVMTDFCESKGSAWVLKSGDGKPL